MWKIAFRGSFQVLLVLSLWCWSASSTTCRCNVDGATKCVDQTCVLHRWELSAGEVPICVAAWYHVQGHNFFFCSTAPAENQRKPVERSCRFDLEKRNNADEVYDRVTVCWCDNKAYCNTRLFEESLLKSEEEAEIPTFTESPSPSLKTPNASAHVPTSTAQPPTTTTSTAPSKTTTATTNTTVTISSTNNAIETARHHPRASDLSYGSLWLSNSTAASTLFTETNSTAIVPEKATPKTRLPSARSLPKSVKRISEDDGTSAGSLLRPLAEGGLVLLSSLNLLLFR